MSAVVCTDADHDETVDSRWQFFENELTRCAVALGRDLVTDLDGDALQREFLGDRDLHFQCLARAVDDQFLAAAQPGRVEDALRLPDNKGWVAGVNTSAAPV